MPTELTNGDKYRTRAEAEEFLRNNAQARQDAFDAHEKVHSQDERAVRTALDAVSRERTIHSEAHNRDHEHHERIHQQEQTAVATALSAVAREREIHSAAHEREHMSHQKEHDLAGIAINKAESATNIRFSSFNEFRGQLGDLINRLASKETVEASAKENSRRYDELRERIIAIEKADVKGEGKQLGQTAMVALIVGAVSFVATILGIVIVVANFATG